MVTDVERLRLVYELDDKPAAKAFERVRQALNKANAEIERGSREAEAAVAALGKEGDALKDRFDPAYAAARKFKDEVGRLDSLLKAGGVTQKQYRVALEGLATSYDGAARQGMRFGGGLQKIGYQVGDFAVQVGAGTSAAQALGQQLPQLLGGMGAVGAIAGAAAAIMIPLGSALIRTAFDAETLEDRTKALENSTDAMADAAENANTPLSVLEARYGSLADKIQRASQASALFTAAIARKDALSAVNSLGKSFGFTIPSADELPQSWAGGVDRNRQRAADLQRAQAMAQLRRETGATADQFDRLTMAINRTNSSNSLDAVVRDSENLSTILAEIALSPGITDEQFQRLSKWQAQVDAVATQTARQIAAEKAGRQSLIDTYDKTTQALAKNADELKRAEAERAKAAASGQTEEIALWDRIIDKINEARRATVQAALETDAAFAKMAASFPSMDEFRRGTSAEYFGAQYIAARTQGAGSRDEELVRATAAAAEQLGIATKDLLSIIMLESGGNPSIRGGAGNRHIGLIQFGPEEQRKYGANQSQSITEQMPAVVRYLMDRGVKPGMALPNVYAAVNAGQAHLVNRGDRKNGGIVDNIYDFTTGDKMKRYLNQAEGLLSAYPDIAKGAVDAAKAQEGFAKTIEGSSRSLQQQAEAIGKSAEQTAYLAKKNELVNAAVAAGIDPATQAAEIERQAQAAGVNARLAEEIKLREKNSAAMKQMGEQLSANLLTEQQTAQLEAQRAQALAAIQSSGMTDADKAAAIAQVNAEMQRQVTIMGLVAEAQRRGVDLDTQMIDSTLTYRDAINALGDAQYARAIADQQAAAASDQLRQSQEFAQQQTQALKDGLVDAIIEGENFADVIGNVAKSLAKASLQAALFGQGPMAGMFGIGEGKGLLSGILGFASGGYTGSGGRYDPAGIVHKGEYVMSAPAVARIGLPNLEALHRGAPVGGAAPMSVPFAPNISIAPGVTREELTMTMATARREYEQNFIPMLRKKFPEYQQRSG